jgi:hypothetical protein
MSAWIAPLFLPTPPSGDAINSELWCVIGRADTNEAFVVSQVVDTEGNGNTIGLRAKIVVIDEKKVTASGVTGIFEVADEFFFLGVDADNRHMPRS